MLTLTLNKEVKVKITIHVGKEVLRIPMAEVRGTIHTSGMLSKIVADKIHKEVSKAVKEISQHYSCTYSVTIS